MKVANPLADALSVYLATQDFKRKSSTWYCDREQSILVVNLQRSQWGRQYHVNLAIWLKQLGETRFPKEHHCHIRWRLDSLLPPDQEAWLKSLLDLESRLDEEKRKSKLVELIADFGLPMLRLCETEQSLREAIESGRLQHAFVRVAVLNHLQLSA